MVFHLEMLTRGAFCQKLEGRIALEAALRDLHRLLSGWVTPRLAVSPSARRNRTLNPVTAEEVRGIVASLPPLPADWQPVDRSQQARYQKLRTP
jgi:hypothetical protein